MGTYTLKTTAKGYESQEEKVTLKIGENQNKSLRLNKITSTTSITSATTTSSKTNSKKLKIGDKAHGGIVFYLDGKGGGLVCAEINQSTDARWGCAEVKINGTKADIGTGKLNTSILISKCNESGIVSKICDDLVLNGYNDWFLPSKDELNLMYVNLKKEGIGDFASACYWSSSEHSSGFAWEQNFRSGAQSSYFKYTTNYVRAVRAF